MLDQWLSKDLGEYIRRVAKCARGRVLLTVHKFIMFEIQMCSPVLLKRRGSGSEERAMDDVCGGISRAMVGRQICWHGQ